MVREEKISNVSLSFTIVELRQANHIVKVCADANFGNGIPFSFSKREDLVLRVSSFKCVFQLHLVFVILIIK